MGGTATTSSFCPITNTNIADFLNFFTCLISKSVIPLLIALAVIVFIWGVLKFIMNAEDSTKREEGRNFIIWGLVGLFVMVSIWGIVNILNSTFGVSNVIPQLPS